MITLLSAITDKQMFGGATVLFMVALLFGFYYDNFIFLGIPFALVALPLAIKDIRYAYFFLIASIPCSFGLDISMDFPDEFLMLFLSVLTIVWLVFHAKKSGLKQFATEPMFIIMVLSLVWILVSCICSENFLLSIKFLLKKIWYWLPFFILPLVLFQERNFIRSTAKSLLFPMIVVVSIILFRQALVGFSFEMIYDPLQPFFLNHVLYGSMVSVVLPIAIAALLLSRFLSGQWVFSLLAIAVLLFATYVSYSRAAWLAVIFAVCVFIGIRLKIMQYVMPILYVLFVSTVLWLGKDNRFLSYKPVHDKTVMHETLEDHILATIQGTDISSAERYYRWIAALRMSKDHPILGVGPNNFYDYYKGYVVKSFRTWVSRNPERSTTHNYFIFLLVEQGYPAMILYALLYFMIFFQGQKLYHQASKREDKIIIMAAIMVLAVIFINNFLSELLETDKIGSLFYLSLAVLLNYRVKQKKEAMNYE